MALSEKRKKLKGIGGSEIASICGLSPWGSAHDVWAAKMGLTEDSPPTEAMERGIFLEEGILNWTAKRTGLIIVPNRDAAGEQTPAFSDRHELCFATPDGSVFEDLTPGSGMIAVAEVKCPGSGQDWADPMVVPDGIPSYYLPQVMWEMEAAQCREVPAVVGALVNGGLRVYRIPFSQEMIEILFREAEKFWKYVEKQEPPPFDGSPQAARWLNERYKRSVGEVVKLTGEEESRMAVHVKLYQIAKEQAKAAKDNMMEMEGHLKDFIKERAGIAGEGWKVTWKSDEKGRPAWKKIAEELGAKPQLIEKHTGEPTRRFLVSLEKGGQ